MQLTITDQLTLLEIPLGVSLLEIANTGSATAYRAWERQLQAAPGPLQGVPLGAGNQILYGGAQVPLSGQTLRFICATGDTTTINYTMATP